MDKYNSINQALGSIKAIPNPAWHPENYDASGRDYEKAAASIPTLGHLCDELGNVAEMAMQAKCVASEIADRIGGAITAAPQGGEVQGPSGCLVERLATLVARLRSTLNATHEAHNRASAHLG